MANINTSMAKGKASAQKTFIKDHYHTINEADLPESLPIGTFIWWFGLKSLIPAGWLICNGQGILGDARYTELRRILGYGYVPDLINSHGGDGSGKNSCHGFIKARDNTAEAGPAWSYMAAALPTFDGTLSQAGAHYHDTYLEDWHCHDHGTGCRLSFGHWGNRYGGGTSTAGNHTHTFTQSSSSIFGSSSSDNPVLPACITAIPLIKAYNVHTNTTTSYQPAQSITQVINNTIDCPAKTYITDRYKTSNNIVVTKYSDKWVQQQGYELYDNYGAGQHFVEFAISYPSTSYYLQTTPVQLNGPHGQVYENQPGSNLQTNGFYIAFDSNGRKKNIFWKVSGYIS